MDWNTLRERLSRFVVKNKYVMIIVLAGIVLMSIPSQKQEETQTDKTEIVAVGGLEERLESILSNIEGVGRVQVMITEADSSRTVYQTDDQCNSDGSLRTETVIVSEGSRGENGLIISVTPPTYLGAVVVCQGADRPSVQYAVIQAVSNVTGIGSDRICVVKMK
jgi:stage III sporulation protein AG